MAILVQDVVDQLKSALDAEGSDRYTFDRDFKPAINASARWLVSVINSALGQKKLSEEFFREISDGLVFQTSQDSRVSIDVFPYPVWTITAAYPRPRTGTTGLPTPVPASPKHSILRTDLYHIDSEFYCKRLTIEEWAVNKGNPFEAGFDSINLCDALKSYAYLNPYSYNPTGDDSIKREIEIRPRLNQELITFFFVRRPDTITLLTDTVNLPDSLFQLLFDKAFNFISWKQGDNTNAFSVSQADISQLLNAID